jgi:hypothetical protein
MLEVVTILSRIPGKPRVVLSGVHMGVASRANVAKHAMTEAAKYLQIATITEAVESSIGLPANQYAGTVRMQNEAVQPAATPAGPK